jgi:hypothetical protein
MHGPTGIWWANLTPLSLQESAVEAAEEKALGVLDTESGEAALEGTDQAREGADALRVSAESTRALRGQPAADVDASAAPRAPTLAEEP